MIGGSQTERRLQILLQKRRGAMSLVEAYFDESGTHAGSPFLCIAGYIFEKSKAENLGVEWRSMLTKYQLPHFHMKECAHNLGVFSHLSKSDCDAAAREAIDLIKVHAAKGIAISLEPACFKLLPPNRLWDHPYAFISCQVFYGVEKWADEVGFQGDIDYFFEAGADGQGKASNAMAKIFSVPDHMKKFRCGSHAFLNKNDDQAVALQCADLLAWHWFTHNKRSQSGKKKRKDLASLTEQKNYDLHHYDEATIKKWLNRRKETTS
jgi:Protein of unknown function (DUF3800)